MPTPAAVPAAATVSASVAATPPSINPTPATSNPQAVAITPPSSTPAAASVAAAVSAEAAPIPATASVFDAVSAPAAPTRPSITPAAASVSATVSAPAAATPPSITPAAASVSATVSASTAPTLPSINPTPAASNPQAIALTPAAASVSAAVSAPSAATPAAAEDVSAPAAADFRKPVFSSEDEAMKKYLENSEAALETGARLNEKRSCLVNATSAVNAASSALEEAFRKWETLNVGNRRPASLVELERMDAELKALLASGEAEAAEERRMDAVRRKELARALEAAKAAEKMVVEGAQLDAWRHEARNARADALRRKLRHDSEHAAAVEAADLRVLAATEIQTAALAVQTVCGAENLDAARSHEEVISIRNLALAYAMGEASADSEQDVAALSAAAAAKDAADLAAASASKIAAAMAAAKEAAALGAAAAEGPTPLGAATAEDLAPLGAAAAEDAAAVGAATAEGPTPLGAAAAEGPTPLGAADRRGKRKRVTFEGDVGADYRGSSSRNPDPLMELGPRVPPAIDKNHKETFYRTVEMKLLVGVLRDGGDHLTARKVQRLGDMDKLLLNKVVRCIMTARRSGELVRQQFADFIKNLAVEDDEGVVKMNDDDMEAIEDAVVELDKRGETVNI